MHPYGNNVARSLRSSTLTPRRVILAGHSRPPRAWTLLELLLVLALLVVITSLAMPILDGSFASLRLRRATDQVIAVWIRARTAAIESGRPHQFRFKADTGDYLVEPWPRDEDPAAASPQGKDSSREFLLDLRNEDGTVILHDRLPEGIVLTGGERKSRDSAQSESSPSVVESLAGDTRAPSPYGTGWSAPILFYPDGTTLDASLLLSNSRRQTQRATLRGLTGIGRASPLIPASERAR